MKKYWLIIIMFFCAQSMFAEKYALIVAIGDYPKSTGWHSISSANDVPLIEQVLINQGFSKNNIEILLDSQATYNSIKTALIKLLNKVNAGDIVVIHYSGHGQQIFDDNGEEIDGKDEALVPYDAWVRFNHNYKGENHFRDDELGNYIIKFRNKLKKNGQLLILLDSCHSGSTTRGGLARGSQAVFAPKGWKNSKNEKNKGSDMIEKDNSRLSADAAPFVLISGASANELNYEYKGTGSLTYAFSKAMSNLGSLYSFNQLFAKIETEMNIISPKQNPTIEGDVNLAIFNNNYINQQDYFEVKRVLRGDVIKIQAGKLQGIFINTTVNILPSGTLKFNEKDIVAKGTVLLNRFNESTIQLDNPLKDLNEKKYWVFIDEPTYGDISIDIYFHKSLKDKFVKNEILNFLNERNLGSVVKDNTMADLVIMQKGNTISINTSNGLYLIHENEYSNGIFPIEEMKQKIFGFAQGQYLKNLDLKNYNYEFEFKLLPIEYDEATEDYEILNGTEFLDDKGTFQIKPGEDHVILEVVNKSDRPLYFNIIEINSKGVLNKFFPNEDDNGCSLNNNERKIEPKSKWVFKDCIFEFDPPYEKLVLKGFATPYPINFQNTINNRGLEESNFSNPLEQLLVESFKETRGGSGSSRSTSKIDGFSAEFVYEIIKEKPN